MVIATCSMGSSLSDPGACALGEMHLLINIEIIEARANVVRRLGGLCMLTSEQTAVFWGLSYKHKAPESAIMKKLMIGHAATAGMRDELDDLLIHFTVSHDSGFIIEDWISKVNLASGSKNRDHSENERARVICAS